LRGTDHDLVGVMLVCGIDDLLGDAPGSSRANEPLRPSTAHKRLSRPVRFVYAALTQPRVVSFHATRCLDDRPLAAADHCELRLRVRTEEAALMAGYIVSGVVALAVTVYLFIALLFPERF
jgi:K+-transporting ATPase KdpF subunit